MSHPKQDHVHRLIHALSRSEKRYFKLHVARHAGAAASSNHMALFDAIAGMEHYDEALLKKKFAGASFLSHFPIAKRRLYEAILLSLHAYHTDGSATARMYRLLHQVDILHSKALYTEAERLLRSIITLAGQHEAQGVLMEALDRQQRILELTNYEQAGAKDLERIGEQAAEVLRERAEYDTLRQLKGQAFIKLYRNGQARTSQDLDSLNSLAQHPALADTATPASTRSRYLYHHVRAALAFARGDHRSCMLDLEANVTNLRAAEWLVAEEPQLLMAVLGNLAHLQMRHGRSVEAFENLKLFRRIPLLLPSAPSPDLELRIFAMGNSMELSLLARSGRFAKAAEKASAVEKELSDLGDRLGVLRRTSLLFQAAWAHFGNGDHVAALRASHRMLGQAGIDHHPELHGLGRVLHLMVLLEHGNKEDTAQALRNTERHLRTRQRTFRFEQAMLAHAHEQLRRKDVPADHQPIRDTLAALMNDPLERAVFDHFDPLVWAESRATGRSMAEVAMARTTTNDREAA